MQVPFTYQYSPHRVEDIYNVVSTLAERKSEIKSTTEQGGSKQQQQQQQSDSDQPPKFDRSKTLLVRPVERPSSSGCSRGNKQCTSHDNSSPAQPTLTPQSDDACTLTCSVRVLKLKKISRASRDRLNLSALCDIDEGSREIEFFDYIKHGETSPGIVECFRSFSEIHYGVHCYIGFEIEFTPGLDLMWWIETHRHNLDSHLCEIQRIIKDLLSAIQFLHQRQITHRDIKPENVGVVASDLNQVQPGCPVIKLLDFGFAYRCSQPRPRTQLDRTQLLDQRLPGGGLALPLQNQNHSSTLKSLYRIPDDTVEWIKTTKILTPSVALAAFTFPPEGLPVFKQKSIDEIVCGTPLFLVPRLLRSMFHPNRALPLDDRCHMLYAADIWATGMTLLNVMLGVHPFENSKSLPELSKKVMTEHVTPESLKVQSHSLSTVLFFSLMRDYRQVPCAEALLAVLSNSNRECN